MRIKGTLLAAAVILFWTGVSSAQTDVAVWDFEGETTTPATDLNGGASATLGPGNFSESFPAGDGSADSWSANHWLGEGLDEDDYFQFIVNTTNSSGLTLSFAERRSGTGPPDFEVHYSTDGSVFTQLPATVSSTSDSVFQTHNFDLSATTALNNQPTLYFRMYAYNAPSTSGTWRLDDVTVTMATVPVELLRYTVE